MAIFETLEVSGWLAAIEGMRAPFKSYSNMESYMIYSDKDLGKGTFVFGDNDYQLAKRLVLAGPEHCKWRRQIQVWVKITAPRYFFQEFDTYKIGTTANSNSTMHTLLREQLTRETVSLPWDENPNLDNVVEAFFDLYNAYIMPLYQKAETKEEKEKILLYLKGLLPEGYISSRYVNLNYEVLANMYRQRKNHRLAHWHTDFVNWIETLPFHEFITGEGFVDN